MTTASQAGLFNFQALTSLGTLAASYRLYTYAPSTTTLKTAYTDAAASVPHSYTSDGLGGSYIALDARGELPAPLYLTSGGYDLCLKTSAGATVWTRRAGGIADDLLATLSDASSASNGDALVAVKSTATGAIARTQHSKNAEVVSVLDFGAVGDGATDDTTAISNAIAAVIEGGTVYFPPSTGHYVFTQLTITKTVTLLGAGWHCGLQANFADAAWLSTSYVSGSILRSTYTGAGSAITCTTTNKAPRFKNIALIGPGAGTSTAITFGSLANYQVLGKWDDFFIANFYNGPVWSNVEDWQCSSVRIRAMSTNGFTLQSGGATVNTTNDVFYNLEIQRCTTGMLITEAYTVEFHGGLIQNCTNAIKLVPSANGRIGNIAWHKTWLENNTNNVVLDLTSGGIQWLEFSGTHHNGSGNFFNITNPANNTVTRLRLSDVVASGFALDLSPGASVGPAYVYVGGGGNAFSSVTPSNATGDLPVLPSARLVTLAANATTIDASTGSIFVTQANGGATALASITKGTIGQTIRIYGGSSTNATTIPDSGAFKLNTAAGTMTLSATNSIVLTTPDGTNWYEDSRSVNA